MNYARKLVSIFLCVLIFAFSFAACGSSGEAADESESINRFYAVDRCFIDDPTTIDGDYRTYILVDRETKVCYLYGPAGNRSFMTALLDAEGKPLIWEGK